MYILCLIHQTTTIRQVFLADSISSWYSKCKNITFDTSIAHRKYYRYHNNLIGTTHGDGAKPQDLPILMAQRQGKIGLMQKTDMYTYTTYIIRCLKIILALLLRLLDHLLEQTAAPQKRLSAFA